MEGNIESLTGEGGVTDLENHDLNGKTVSLKMTSLETKQVLVAKSYSL